MRAIMPINGSPASRASGRSVKGVTSMPSGRISKRRSSAGTSGPKGARTAELIRITRSARRGMIARRPGASTGGRSSTSRTCHTCGRPMRRAASAPATGTLVLVWTTSIRSRAITWARRSAPGTIPARRAAARGVASSRRLRGTPKPRTRTVAPPSRSAPASGPGRGKATTAVTWSRSPAISSSRLCSAPPSNSADELTYNTRSIAPGSFSWL